MTGTEGTRPTLGPFMNVVCFRYLRDTTLELAGRALIIDAGRQRGRNVIETMGMQNAHQDAEEIRQALDHAVGLNGTRLCILERIEVHDDGGYEVTARECACPTYTLGVLIGAISVITGNTMIGKEISTTEDGIESIYHIEPL